MAYGWSEPRTHLFEIEPIPAIEVATTSPSFKNKPLADMKRLDEEQANPAWPIQIEVPIAIDLTKENLLKDRDDFIIFSN